MVPWGKTKKGINQIMKTHTKKRKKKNNNPPIYQKSEQMHDVGNVNETRFNKDPTLKRFIFKGK